MPLSRGEDSHRPFGSTRRGQYRRAVPPRGDCPEPLLSLVEGISGGRQEAPGRRHWRAATADEVTELRREASALKEVVAELTLCASAPIRTSVSFLPNRAAHATDPVGRVSESQETPDAENPAMGTNERSSLAGWLDLDPRKRAPPTQAHFHVGAFDRAAERPPTGHIFRKERLPWLHLGEAWAGRRLRRLVLTTASL